MRMVTVVGAAGILAGCGAAAGTQEPRAVAFTQPINDASGLRVGQLSIREHGSDSRV